MNTLKKVSPIEITFKSKFFESVRRSFYNYFSPFVVRRIKRIVPLNPIAELLNKERIKRNYTWLSLSKIIGIKYEKLVKYVENSSADEVDECITVFLSNNGYQGKKKCLDQVGGHELDLTCPIAKSAKQSYELSKRNENPHAIDDLEASIKGADCCNY